MTNPWHDVSIGANAPDEIDVIIEVPKDEQIKYELDKESGLLRIDRTLYSAVHYPGNYGFIPKTYWDDGDPMDILIISNSSFHPLSIVTIRPIGVIKLTDGQDSDDKILGVQVSDPRFSGVKSLRDVPEHMLIEIKHFFETYKLLQNKKVKVLSIRGRKEARKAVLRSIKLYEQKFLK